MKDLILREARDDDGPGVVALVATMYAQYENCYCDPVSEEVDLMKPATNFDKFWVLQHKSGWIVGSFGLVFHSNLTELKKVYLIPRYHGQGLASKLWAHASDYFQGDKVVAWSDTRFHSGHQFYRRKGFTQGETRLLDDLSYTQEFLFEKAL